MPSSTDCWGIEVGASAIKAIRLQKNGKEITLADYDVIPFKKVLTTPDLDVDEAIRVGLDKFLSRHSIGKASVVVSVPGHKAFARFAKLPPVEPKRVPDIVKFEAVQQIPFPIEEVEWDYQTFKHTDSPDVEVGIFAITKERVYSWLSNFEAVGIQVHGLTLAPISVYNAMAYDLEIDEDAPGTILMDIGTSATDMIILEGGRIWLRTIPIGGHHFTEALVRSFKLSYSKAEKIKHEAATSKYAKQIFQAMRPVFVDLASEVQKSLGFYQSLARDADLTKLVGLGSTFRLPGLQKFLKQQLQMDVSRLDKFERIEPEGKSASTFAENTLTLAPAYGLALQGLEEEKVTCNILPTELVQQQVWKAKQPWAIGAAALVALAAGIGFARLWMDQQAYASNQPTQAKIEQVLNAAAAKTTAISSVANESNARVKIENLRRILDYRRVWPLILADIQNALASADPQPELLSGDPEQIQAIDRSERRQILLEQIQHQYVYSGTAATADQIWGERVYITAPAEGAATGSPATGSPAGGDAATASIPTFEISVVGITPNAQAPTFLNDTFVQWLMDKEAAMQEQDALYRQNPAENEPRNRPYRITQVELYDVKPAAESGGRSYGQAPLPGEEATSPGSGGRSIPGAGRSVPGRGRDFGRQMAERMAAQRGGGGRDQAYQRAMQEAAQRGMQGGRTGNYGPGMTGSGAAAPTFDTAELAPMMPKDPLADEDKSSDWRFVIRWRVELVRPEATRQIDPQNNPTSPPDEPRQPVADAEDFS